jgi:hypothetical protein
MNMTPHIISAPQSRRGPSATRRTRATRLRARHFVVTAAADAAAGRGQGMGRQLRSELKILSALLVAGLRSEADDLALQLREVDARIQKSNWEFDLLE